MNTNPSAGQPRVLSLEEFAALIRKMREVFQWAQETLAELAGLNVRTVQRVENAKSASTDTRRALAAAFEIEDIDALRMATYGWRLTIRKPTEVERFRPPS